MKNAIKFCVALGCCATFPLFAQNRYDWNWTFGLASKKQDSTRALLKFTENSTEVISIPLYEYPSVNLVITACASTSNPVGEPQFLTDGCKVFSYVSMDTMENGHAINSPGEEFDFSCVNGSGYWSFQGIMALPKPESKDEYVLFHLRYDSIFRRQPVSVLHTDIDMSFNNGAGRVMQKNVRLMTDSFSDQMSAVRHGNGRDWWIVLSQPGTMNIALFLLTEKGIEGPFIRPCGLVWVPALRNAPRMSKGIFSPDGQKYARTNVENRIQLFCFDRCAGEFSCPQLIDIQDAVDVSLSNNPDFLGLNKENGAHGLAFSPNGRFLYASTPVFLFQFDLEAKDIQSSWKLVGKMDDFLDPFPTSIHQLLLAPNGKIYVSATNSMTFLHTIHSPNKLGKESDFRNHDFPLGYINGFVLPNYLNFRLYDWADSPCDTLGIDAPADSVKTVWHYSDESKVAPNPADEKVFIELPPDCNTGSIEFYDAACLLIHEIAFSNHGEVYEIDLRAWAAGVYFVSFYSNESSPITKKTGCYS